jgi:iron complex outermembrane recepter protein
MTRLGMTGRFTLTSLTTLLLLPLLPSAPALAQATLASSNDTQLQEVTVTATRREERAQDVPISLSAYSQEKLDMEGLRNIDDVTRLEHG